VPVTKIVLLLPLKEPDRLSEYITQWVSGGVDLVWAFGDGAEDFHDMVDWKMIEMGIDVEQMPVTNATQPEPKNAKMLADIVQSAKNWISDPPGETKIVSF